MLIDLHIHTKRGSRCSSLDSKELVKQAKKMRLDAVCITDHNTFEAVQVTKEAGKEEGLLVFGGMEVRCREGDILTFGLQEPPKSGIPASELLEIVKSSGARRQSSPTPSALQLQALGEGYARFRASTPSKC